MNHHTIRTSPTTPTPRPSPSWNSSLTLLVAGARAHWIKVSYVIRSPTVRAATRRLSFTKLTAVHASLESHVREEKQDTFQRISKVWSEAKPEQARTEIKEMRAEKAKPAPAR